MEITFKDGDRITIPEGCKATINGNEVVIEKKEIKFKDGDILTSKNGFLRCPFIFKGYDDKGFYKFYAGMACGKTLVVYRGDGGRWGNSELSYATDEEKQLLFDKMKEQGLRWNAEEKRVEKIRWRAVKGGAYYFFGTTGNVCRAEDDRGAITNHRYNAFNYFQTEDQTEKAAEAVKETLRKFHEENEENL